MSAQEHEVPLYSVWDFLPSCCSRGFSGQKRSFPHLMILDTGADIFILSAELADQFDLNLAGGKKTEISGVGGRSIGFLHHIDIAIRKIKFQRVPIVFIEHLPLPSYGILGHEGLFDKIKLKFDFANKEFEIVAR